MHPLRQATVASRCPPHSFRITNMVSRSCCAWKPVVRAALSTLCRLKQRAACHQWQGRLYDNTSSSSQKKNKLIFAAAWLKAGIPKRLPIRLHPVAYDSSSNPPPQVTWGPCLFGVALQQLGLCLKPRTTTTSGWQPSCGCKLWHGPGCIAAIDQKKSRDFPHNIAATILPTRNRPTLAFETFLQAFLLAPPRK